MSLFHKPDSYIYIVWKLRLTEQTKTKQLRVKMNIQHQTVHTYTGQPMERAHCVQWSEKTIQQNKGTDKNNNYIAKSYLGKIVKKFKEVFVTEIYGQERCLHLYETYYLDIVYSPI